MIPFNSLPGKSSGKYNIFSSCSISRNVLAFTINCYMSPNQDLISNSPAVQPLPPTPAQPWASSSYPRPTRAAVCFTSCACYPGILIGKQHQQVTCISCLLSSREVKQDKLGLCGSGKTANDNLLIKVVSKKTWTISIFKQSEDLMLILTLKKFFLKKGKIKRWFQPPELC